METFCQIWLSAFGLGAITLVGRTDYWRRWGYVLGLLSQPAWLYTAYSHGQLGVFLLSCAYTVVWFRGLRNNWTHKGTLLCSGK